jgi:predicted site-specific integrase-resolvase
MHCATVSPVASHRQQHASPTFIGSAEVARLLKINQVTVARWVASGDLQPVHKLPGKNGAYLFKRADIEDLAAKRSEEASA